MRFEDWRDPYPPPKVVVYEGIHVVRDDLLGVGSKARFADYLIGHDPEYTQIEEWVYGSSPATGYAQISIPAVCSRYGKRAVLFMARRDPAKLHEYQRRGAALGAVYNWVDMGMLTVTEARAREYAAKDPLRRKVLPIGLEHPTVRASIVRVAHSLPIVPEHIWSVGSSGTLSRGLQEAFPDAKAFVVSVGHGMKEHEVGRAMMLRSPYKFDRAPPMREMPPFESSVTYDAKGWQPMIDFYKKHPRPSGPILFWNVGG